MQERDRPLRVFVSSASGALAPYRQTAVDVCHRLGMLPEYMEDFDPERPPPADVCHRKIDSCDVFVLLLAHRYGSRPAGAALSYTELEYERALARPDMDLLAFVVEPSFPWPPPDVDTGPDAEALGRFVARVSRAHLTKRLAEIERFREDLLVALKPLEDRRRPAPAANGTSSRPTAPTFHAMPPYVGSAPFTGRVEDLATLDEWGRSSDPVMVVEAIGGTGKSALTWEWATRNAPDVVERLSGRLWWSFYDGSASMTRFLREVLAYVSGRPPKELRGLGRADLSEQVSAALRSRPCLLVLDGFERLLAAYHRFDPSKLRDDEVEPAKRSLIEPHAEDVVRALTAAGPSKILISTRLMPDALEGRFGTQMPGVRHLRLPGLTDADTVLLLSRLGVHGDPAVIAGFFGRLGNHPLLVGIVAGLVRDYRPDPGGFDRWLADPTAGGALGLPDIDLTQRRAHILDAALAGLSPGNRQLLGWISVLAGAVDWKTLEAINPFRPAPPDPGGADFSSTRRRPRKVDRRDADHRRAVGRWSDAATGAEPRLDAALKDLEDRGLLWWDRASNSYDQHPIVRAYVHDQLEDNERVRANERVRDHFEALPVEHPEGATSVEDLRQTITLFRALVGAGQPETASDLWSLSLEWPLVIEIGALPTAVELLAPLAPRGSNGVRADLVIALSHLGRYEEAIEQEVRFLPGLLQAKNYGAVRVGLSRLLAALASSGYLVGRSRCLELWTALSIAIGPLQDEPGLIKGLALDAGDRGDLELALRLMTEADGLVPPQEYPWYEGDLALGRLRWALAAREPVTEADIDEVDSRLRYWAHRTDIARLRCEFWIRRKDFNQALTAAQEYDRIQRNGGLETAPSHSAYLLAKLDRPDEATVAVEETLRRLPRIHPAARPHYPLAQALWELGRHDEAVSHGLDAYRQAWCDGPPYCRFWALRDARELLELMGVEPPDLPTTDPATVRVPFEDEIRALAAKLSAEREGP